MSIEAMKLIDPHDHPEPHTMKWTQAEMDYINNRVETAVCQAIEQAEKQISLNISKKIIEQAQKQIPPSAYSNTHQPEQAQKDHTYGYAKHLAETIFKLHFASDEHYASGRIVWGVNDTVIGILTQIDNMVADMVRKPEQAQPSQGDIKQDHFPDATKMVTQKQEPVAMQMDVIVVNLVREGINKHRARELAEHFIKHTSPPQRQSAGLTDEEMYLAIRPLFRTDALAQAALQISKDEYRAIEAKLKEKNT